MEITNLKQLEAIINKKIADALQKEVASTVKQVMAEQVEETVYQSYEPKLYVRKMDDGGLSDERNMESTMLNDTTLSVENIRYDGDKNVAETVITGKGYDYSFPYDGVPRDFIEATREELRNTNEHVYALYKGLKRQGLNVSK